MADSQLHFYDPRWGSALPDLADVHEIWDVALICNNGHVVNDRARGNPSLNASFCSLCGAHTISSCPGCREPIPGYYYRLSRPSGLCTAPSGRPLERVPQYCHACGRPLPWTERTMSGARALIREITSLEPYERDQLRRSIDDIVRETPKTPLAVARINTVLARVGGKHAEALREILVSIASDSVKQRLLDCSPPE